MEVANSKKIAKNTLMLYFRMVLSMIVTLYTSRLVINALGIEDFGIYNLVAGVIIMFGFLNSAMSATTLRFLTYEKGKEDKDKITNVFNVSLTIHIIIALLVLLLAETMGVWFVNNSINIPVNRIYAVNLVYQFSVFTFVFNILNAPFNAVIIANEKMSIFAFVGIFETFLKLIVVFLLYLFSFDKLVLYAFLLFLVSVIIRLSEGIYCSRTFRECRNKRLTWDKKLFVEMGNFAGWNLFGVAAGVGYNQGVNILLNAFFGVTINAARGIAFQVQGAISNLVTNFQMASAPTITKLYSKKELDETFRLVFSTSKFSFYLLLFFSIPILIETKTILIYWLKIIPNYTVIFTQLIIIDILVNSLSGPLHILVQATGNIKKYQLFVSGLLMLNLPTSYLFLKFGYNPQITILISIVYSVLALYLRLIFLKKHITFPMKKYFITVVLRIVIVASISIFIPLIVNSYLSNSIYNLILLFVLSSLSILFSVYFFGLNQTEKIFLLSKTIKRIK